MRYPYLEPVYVSVKVNDVMCLQPNGRTDGRGREIKLGLQVCLDRELAGAGAIGFVLFSALIISSYPQLSAGKVIIFSLKVCRLNNREAREGEVLGPMGRKYMVWMDWVGRVGGWW